MTNILETKLEECQKEVTQMREVLVKQTEKLAAAELALIYYANPTNYQVPRGLPSNGSIIQNILQNDLGESDNLKNVLIGGKRARLYFKNYGTN